MRNTYYLYTVQLARWRIVAESGIELLDCTAKSGIDAFAPTFHNVMLYKGGHLSKDEYAELYLKKMRESRAEQPEQWRKLLTHRRLAIACYCGAGQFCHRHLFLQEAKQYLENLGNSVVSRGEITHVVVAEDPQTTPQPMREVIGFHGKEDLLSNWNPRGFTIKNVKFPHGEAFMMYAKAKLFKDEDIAAKILQTSDPWDCKRLGRKVALFDVKVWNERSRRIVFLGCLQKAREHPDVAAYLLSTSGKILVEASPSDLIWGVGLTKNDPKLQDPSQWRGTNWLGECWMQVRTILEAEIIF